MIKIEQNKQTDLEISSAPMDSDDSKPPNESPFENESISMDRMEMKESSQVKDLGEQKSRNSEIMKSPD